MRETFSPVRQRSGGSCPSEAHCGGWEGLGEDGWEPTLWKIASLIVNNHRNGNAYEVSLNAFMSHQNPSFFLDHIQHDMGNCSVHIFQRKQIFDEIIQILSVFEIPYD